MRLRPSMRENFRYLLAKISPVSQFDTREIYVAASDSFNAIYGDIAGARAWLAVMEYSTPYVIFRYRRGEDSRVEAAITCVCTISGLSVAIHPLKRSGTIKTLREFLRPNVIVKVQSGTVKIEGETYQADIYPGKRIDLKEKGINLQVPQYITEEDIKDLNYDE